MRLLFRISIALYSLFSMAIWLMAIIIIFFKRSFLDKSLHSAAENLKMPFLATRGFWAWILLISIVCLVFNLYIFLSGIRGGKERRAIKKETPIGEIRIASATFENIAINVIRRLSGVRDARAYIRIKDNEIRMLIRAVFLTDVNIPVLCEEAQNRIKQAVEACTGVMVSEVRVLVDGVYTVYKGRVE